jgi:hypothetical protein
MPSPSAIFRLTGVIAMAVALKDLAGAPLEPWHHEAQVAMAVGLVLYPGGFVAVVLRGKGYLLVGRLILLGGMVATTLLSPLPAGLTAMLLALELGVALILEIRHWNRHHAASSGNNH